MHHILSSPLRYFTPSLTLRYPALPYPYPTPYPYPNPNPTPTLP